jgi:hypothetical protein
MAGGGECVNGLKRNMHILKRGLIEDYRAGQGAALSEGLRLCGKGEGVINPLIGVAAALNALFWVASVHAQSPGCTEDSKIPTFALTDANRLSLAQFRARIVGRQIILERNRTSGTGLTFTIVWHEDGSSVGTCQSRMRTGIAHPCVVNVAGGARDVWTWRALDASGVLCGARTGSASSQDYCYSIHEQAGRFALKFVSGTLACLPGDLHVQ